MTTTRHQPLVSIVVPIYGVEEWLEACLRSVQSQTYRNFEAILVVDGSLDGSESIARAFAAEDDRFRLFVTENQGLGAARNFGIEQATGELLTFLDSDDTFTPRALGWLVEALAGTDAEIACGLGVDTFDDGRRKRYWTHLSAPQFLHLATGVYTLADTPSLLDDHTAWAKLFRRDFFDRVGVRFPVGVHCEDIVPILTLELAATSIAVVPLETYEHRRHDAAISADYVRPRTLSDWLDQTTRALDVITAHGDRSLIRHYVGKHLPRQWWGRTSRFTSFDTDLLQRCEELSARIVDALDGEVDLSAPLVGRTIAAFADSLPSRAWTGIATTPFVVDQGFTNTDSARAAAALVERLDPRVENERHLAAELLLVRVILPVARGTLPDDDAAELLRFAREHIDVLGSETFSRVRIPPHGPVALPPRASARDGAALLASLPVVGAQVHSAVADSRGLVLRGDAWVGPIDLDETLLVVSARVDDGAPYEVPTTSERDPERPEYMRWQASIADVDPERITTAFLAVRRPYLPAVDLPIRLAPEAGLPDGWTVRSSSPLGMTRTPTGHEAEIPTALAPAAVDERRRVFTYPNWYSNPYMTMLHLEARGAGYALPGTTAYPDLIAELDDRDADGVIHIHWPSPVTDQAGDAEDAEARVDELSRSLRGAHDRGRPIVWTLHNALPHDARYPQAAIRLHQSLADLADRVHVLNPHTLESIGDAYTVDPAKVRLIEHPSYLGVYGAGIDKATARRAIGADAEARAVLFFGQLRPYKGLERLFDAARLLQPTHPVELLLAGKPAPQLAGPLAEIRDSDVRVVSALRFIEDDEVATWFSAADVAVLPYQKVLNSGTAHLAATYGVPVIMPAERPVIAELGEQPWARFFDVDDPVQSIADLLADDWYLDPDLATAARRFARGRSPVRTARAYLDLLESLPG